MGVGGRQVHVVTRLILFALKVPPKVGSYDVLGMITRGKGCLTFCPFQIFSNLLCAGPFSAYFLICKVRTTTVACRFVTRRDGVCESAEAQARSPSVSLDPAMPPDTAKLSGVLCASGFSSVAARSGHGHIPRMAHGYSSPF